MKKAEKILIVLSIIAMVLNILFVPLAGVLTILTLMVLAVFYFYFGFAVFIRVSFGKIFKKDSYNEIGRWRIIGAICAGFVLSETMVGLLFKLQHWPGASLHLGVGLVGLLIVTLVGIVKYIQNKSEYYTGIFKRAAIFGGLGLILMFTPAMTINEVKYRNHPAYMEALKILAADPGNKELQDNAEMERKKMIEGKD